MKLNIPSTSEYKDIVSKAIEETLERELPRLIRKATQKQYLTTDETMELLQVSRKQLYFLRTIEALPYIKEGRRIYYDIDDIHAYMKENKIS